MAATISAARPECPLFVCADATQQVLVWDEVVSRLREAYAVPHASAESPPRTVARGRGTWLRTLTAVPTGSRFMGAKIFGLGRQKTLDYLIVLTDQETGRIVGFVDANYVTGYRTAATSAVAVDRMAPAGGATLGVLGSGLEARSHVRAIASIRPVDSLRVFSPTRAHREAFAETFTEELGVPCMAADSAEAAVRGATLVIAAARSHDESPILRGEWLDPGMVVVSIGSTLPEQREIDEHVVDVCDLIVCDAVEEVVEETGDMLAARAADIRFGHKLVSLNELISGAVDDRLAASALPMFKSVGAALQDILVAELAFDKALARGLATPLSIEFLTKDVRPRPLV